MRKQIAFVSVVVLFSLCDLAFHAHSASADSSRPLRRSEVLALVAGSTLPENIVGEIGIRGVRTAPDPQFIALLTAAGADLRVLNALKGAKVSAAEKPESPDDSALLQHLSNAGKMISAGQSQAAINDLGTILSSGSGKSEAGFVMGLILISQGRYGEAGQIYSEIESDDPSFPQVHTRLSLTYYQSGDPQNGLREAKIALAQNPNDIPAHLNAGLSLAQMGNFDAAKLELEACIRSKPDYALAYAGLANVLSTLKDYDGAIAQLKERSCSSPTTSTCTTTSASPMD